MVELLVAITIIGIAGVAVMAGLMMSVEASDIHRKQTASSAYLRNYAEAIQSYVATSGATNYKACAAANYYSPSLVGFTSPSGYSVSQDAALSVSPTGATSSCATDTGVQLITLHVSSTDHRASEQLAIVLRKPCDPSVTACT